MSIEDNKRTMDELQHCHELVADLRRKVAIAKSHGDAGMEKKLQRQLNSVYVWAERITKELEGAESTGESK